MSSRLSAKHDPGKQRMLPSSLILAALSSFLSLMLTWYATSDIGMRGSRLLAALCFILILLGWYRSWLRESRPGRESTSSERSAENIIYEAEGRRGEWWSLLDRIPGMIIVMRADGGTEYVNRRLMEHNNHATRRDYDNPWWKRMVHPDDVDILTMQWEAAVIARTSFECEYRTRHSDGTWHWVRTQFEPFQDPAGGSSLWFGAVIDIHEQRLTEEALRAREQHLRLVTETIPALMWVSTSDGSPSYFNRRAIEYTGSTVDSLGAAGCKQFIHPEDIKCTWETWEAAVSSGNPYDVSRRLRGADGTFRWFHARAEPFRDQQGKIVCWYGFDIDIDDRLKAEERSRIAQANLLRATQLAAAGELSASIAHEINQPLTAAVANGCAGLKFLKEPVNLERARRAIGSAVSDVQSAAEVVQKIRGLFKQAPPERNKLDIGQALTECMRTMQDELRAKSIQLTMHLGSEPQEVYADRVQIQQVINNIVRNAIDVLDLVTGRPRELHLSVESHAGELVRVEFRDNGPGIPDVERIFEPFFTSKEQGLGVGLSICRSIVDAHGGRLAARVSSGWTIFELSLPLYK